MCNITGLHDYEADEVYKQKGPVPVCGGEGLGGGGGRRGMGGL